MALVTSMVTCWNLNNLRGTSDPIVFKSFTRSVKVKGAEIFTSRNYTLRQLSYKIPPKWPLIELSPFHNWTTHASITLISFLGNLWFREYSIPQIKPCYLHVLCSFSSSKLERSTSVPCADRTGLKFDFSSVPVVTCVSWICGAVP